MARCPKCGQVAGQHTDICPRSKEYRERKEAETERLRCPACRAIGTHNPGCSQDKEKPAEGNSK